MAFFSADTGRLLFSDGLLLEKGMPGQQLNERYSPLREEEALCLDAHPAKGGSLALVCALRLGCLCGVTLHVQAVGGKEGVGADRQRAFLFRALGLRDPCPDTRRTVRVACAFGHLLIYSDPYTGSAAARIQYE